MAKKYQITIIRDNAFNELYIAKGVIGETIICFDKNMVQFKDINGKEFFITCKYYTIEGLLDG